MKEATLEYKARDQFQPFHRKQRWMIVVAHRRAETTVATINRQSSARLLDVRLHDALE